ncbi:hypothetical protein [Streptomyces sp. RK75]|uniref:hypothetical protein n=1 Tax=Streptomyces sp. RK75 TaxID=2824895 RepID=UPI001B38CAD3|nr:hypothetical protein [Streptomyces sp. RK75]MBQ0863053.1 hypothetical protein [Streptomyces sp. RK75]
MSCRARNRSLRIALLAVLAVALVAAGAVGGALYERKDRKDPKKFSEVSGSTCAVSASVLDRVVPESHYASVRTTLTREKRWYASKCAVTVDGKDALRISVEQRNAVHKPRRAGTGPGHGRTRGIPGYQHSWSSKDAAGLSVPCTKDTGDGDATKLYIKVQAWREHYAKMREDMVRIAKKTAKANRYLACEAGPVLDDLD